MPGFGGLQMILCTVQLERDKGHFVLRLANPQIQNQSTHRFIGVFPLLNMASRYLHRIVVDYLKDRPRRGEKK